MENKGLTISLIFEAESANYGEGVGNVTALKKLTRGTGESYTYISRQAIRYNIVEQMGINETPLNVDGTVIQFHPDATIEQNPEIDLFGYMKTVKPTRTRSAVVRLSNAVALESYQTDIDFLTNKGLFDRYNATQEEQKDGGNIAQSEIHKSYYAYTITIDLDRVGIDSNDNIEVSSEEKANRVNALLDTVKFLYRDIKGRRENLTPFFAIGGVFNKKNPFFENKLRIKNNNLIVDTIEDVLSLDHHVRENAHVGYMKGVLDNDYYIEDKLKPATIGEFFNKLQESVIAYYNK
jgi:CRISPR-associated protein Cst2